jgi:hypothetical protein
MSDTKSSIVLWACELKHKLLYNNPKSIIPMLDIAREYDPTSIQKIYECILQLYSMY